MYSKIDIKTNWDKNKIPGPGAYRPISINPKGKFPISNYKNVKNIVFGSNKDKRFNYSCIFFL